MNRRDLDPIPALAAALLYLCGAAAVVAGVYVGLSWITYLMEAVR